MTECDLSHSGGRCGRNRVERAHIPQEMSLKNPVSPAARRKEDGPMTHVDQRKHRLLSVCDRPGCREMASKRVLRGWRKSFRAARRKTVVASVLEK